MFYRPAVVVFVIMSPGGYFVRALCNLHEAYLLQPDYNLQEYNDIHTQQKVKRNSIRMVWKSRGGSRGRVQGVRTPPEMTCGFLIQLVFCKKVVYWC